MTTTNEFIQDVKNRSLVPTTQNTISDDTILAWAHDEFPNVLTLITKYNQAQLLVTTTHKTVNQVLMLPPRAMGGNLDDVKIKEAGGQIVDAKMIDRSVRDQYVFSPYTFYIEGNKLVFTRQDVDQADVELTYIRRPSKLVRDSQARQVVQVQTDGIVVNSMADFIGLGKPLDITSVNYSILVKEQVKPTLVDTQNKKILMDPTGIEVGDYVTAANTSVLVQIPEEYISLLAQRVNLRISMSVGDQAAIQSSMALIQELEDKLAKLVSTRMVTKPTKVINRNSFIARGFR